MRLIFGIIIGIVLTVGVAYVADSFPPAAPAGDNAPAAHMVNWDVVQRRIGDLGTTIREAWDKLTGAPQKPAAQSNG